MDAVKEAISFANWIGEKSYNDSWYKYDGRTGRWYIHMIGHITTEDLYDLYIRDIATNTIKLNNQ